MKKAQILGQVFILILAAMIFIMILAYGYKAVASFTQRSEEIAFITFKTDLEANTKAISQDYGSVKKLSLDLPKKYLELCVITLAQCEAKPGANSPAVISLLNNRPLMKRIAETCTQNVFLEPPAPTPILIENIEAENGGFCTKTTSGRAELRLEGLGNKAKISEWPKQQ